MARHDKGVVDKVTTIYCLLTDSSAKTTDMLLFGQCILNFSAVHGE